MTLQQQLVFCKQCDKRSFDESIGLVCSLTQNKPEFEDTCSNFSIDAKAANKAVARQATAEKEKKTPVWTYILIGVIILRVLMRLMRD